MCIRDRISTKFDSWVLALLAALTFAVATLGINVVANFVSAAFDISNVFPKRIDFKRGGYIAALIALVLYPFAPVSYTHLDVYKRQGIRAAPAAALIVERRIRHDAVRRQQCQRLFHRVVMTHRDIGRQMAGGLIERDHVAGGAQLSLIHI